MVKIKDPKCVISWDSDVFCTKASSVVQNRQMSLKDFLFTRLKGGDSTDVLKNPHRLKSSVSFIPNLISSGARSLES